MTENLIIRLSNDPQQAQWLLLDELGQAQEIQQGALADAAALATEKRKVRVLVPGSSVLMLEASIPTRNTQKMLQALPFALEDQLAAPVEEQHFAAATRQADGRIPVAIVTRECMDGWLRQLAYANIEADSMTPDFLCLPLNQPSAETALTMATIEDGLLIRQSRAQGSRVQTALIPEILRQTLTATPDTIDLYCAPSAGSTHITALLEKNIAEDTQLTEHREPLLPLLAANAVRPALDLLQGDYKKRNESTHWWHPWRVPAALAAILLLLTLGTQISHYVILKNKNAALMQQMNAVLQQGFPGARESLIPRADMESRLSAMQNRGDSGSGFLPMVQQVGMALSQIPNTQLNALSYRGGRLEISLLADGVQSLDQFKTLLTEKGKLQVEIQAANNRDDKVEGRILITPAGGA